MNTFHPDLLPETADPVGSTRHECMITLIELYSDIDSVNYYPDFEHGLCTIIVRSTTDNGYAEHTSTFKGVVLEEANGVFSWWRSIKQ